MTASSQEPGAWVSLSLTESMATIILIGALPPLAPWGTVLTVTLRSVLPDPNFPKEDWAL